MNTAQSKACEMEEKIMPIGGQAVIEGVMMRSPDRIVTAVRRAGGAIELKIQEYKSLMQRKKYLNIPIIRGAITLIEVMAIGIKHLNFSADLAFRDIQEEEKKSGKKKKEKKSKKEGRGVLSTFLSVTVALAVGLALFFALPLFVTTRLFDIEKDAFSFNLVAGGFRIFLFLGYIYLISLMKDVKRLFQYHGAEHKSIFAFEKGLELSVANARIQPRLHPRCGTSFLVMVMLVSLLFFALLDSTVIYFHGHINLLIRLATHLPLVPLVGGISYEAIRASAKKPDHPIVKVLISPGLALQRITTREPDDGMLQVALVSLKVALGEAPEKILETVNARNSKLMEKEAV